MHRRLLTSFAGVIALCATAPLFAQNYAGWHGSLDRAAEVAAKTGKPLFVVFRCER